MFDQVLSCNIEKDLAEKMTAQKFPDIVVPHNDEGDAFRHAYFNALNTKSFGSDLAMKLGYAHEFYPNNPNVEFRMDIFNNREGRSIALTYPCSSNTQLADLIYNATANGELRMIYNKGLIPTTINKSK